MKITLCHGRILPAIHVFAAALEQVVDAIASKSMQLAQ